jgi:hypothetical protein
MSSRSVTATVIVDAAAFVGAAVLRAATALLEGRSVDLSGPTVVTIRPWPEGGTGARVALLDGGDEPAAAGGSDGAALIAGVTLGAVGVAALGTAWGLYGVAYGAGEAMIGSDPRNSDWGANRSLRESMIGPGYALGIGGSLLATASLPLWLPQTPGEVPWWSIVVGVLGAGATIPAFLYWPVDGRYESGTVHRYDTDLYGTLWLSMAVPLLAVPVVYLIRLATDPAVSASVSAEITPERATVSVSGRF